MAADSYEVGAKFKEAENTVNTKFKETENTVNTKFTEVNSAVDEKIAEVSTAMNEAKQTLQSGIDKNKTSLDNLAVDTDTRISQIATCKQDTLTFSKLSASISASSFIEYVQNVGKYYAYFTLDVSKYSNIICIIPLGLTHANGNGYDGIVIPTNINDVQTPICLNWTATVGQQIDVIAHFLVISC